jgi:glycosyltransferase involved in cell wall biosynthesis
VGIQRALDEVRRATSILDGIRRADGLSIAASRDGSSRAVRILAAATNSADQLSAIAAVHALGQVSGQSADEVLISLLGHGSLFLREHAAWALGARSPQPGGTPALVRMVADGGFPGMLAQLTLEQWSVTAPEHVALSVESDLRQVTDPDVRARLVETVGRASGCISEQLLLAVAVDPNDGVAARAAAIEALGDRSPSDAIMSVVQDLAQGTAVLADVARLAVFDLTAQPYPQTARSQGSAIAQVFLHADIDRELSQVGAGDNGGIATLLVRLGDALVAESQTAGDGAGGEGRARVKRVVTISRGTHADALSSLSCVRSAQGAHAFATVPFLGGPVPAVEAWPRRIATQRGIARVLRAAGPIRAIHLRMAEVGSLAAATVARSRGIPIVFTVAPDPHAVIDSLDAAGALTRESFGTVDEGEHFWFRARLVQRITADAAHIVLFPRQELKRDMRRLLGIDIAAYPRGHSVLAEGIDLKVIERSCAEVRVAAGAAEAADGVAGAAAATLTGAPAAPLSSGAALALEDLDALLRSLPAARRGLPLAVTVGRLHRVKGMATLVEAWAGDPGLRQRCNLLVVGGDLEHPSGDEQEQLSGMEAVTPLADAPARGLLLAGHRANGTVAYWLAAARYGRPGLAAPAGAYVCASVKEEFGLALLEAMATGLAVVAPGSGGPATYIENGVTGFLVDTRDTRALARAVADALDFAAGPGGDVRAERARETVARNFTIEAMAASLSDVYAQVGEAHDPRRPVTSPVMVS